MTLIRAEFAPAFYYGDDVVLLAMDRAGVNEFARELQSAEAHGSAELEHNGTTHQIVIVQHQADIQLEDTLVVWRLDPDKAREILSYLRDLSAGEGQQPCHQYVDIRKPADMLILSRDEYVDRVARPSPERWIRGCR